MRKPTLDEWVAQWGCEMDGLREVQLWYVRGLEGQYWMVKLNAEAAARKAFPDEGPQKNYARVWFRKFYQEEV